MRPLDSCMLGLMSDRSDELQDTQDLVREARDGNPEAFSQLYTRLAPALRAWIGLQLSPTMQARIEVEDLMHEVWWRALDAFRSYDAERASFRTWLFTIAKRVYISALRRARTVADRGIRSDSHHSLGNTPASVTEIHRRLARDEVFARVLESLRAMDETDQAIFSYCGLEGHSAARCAALVGLSRDAVLKRWQRLREELRLQIPDGERLLLDQS